MKTGPFGMLVGGLLALAAMPAFAAAPVRVTGTIMAVDGNSVTLAPPAGDKVTVRLKDDARVFLMAPVKPSDIKAGEFIGAGSIRAEDGVLHARSIFVFPEALRGAGEGEGPWSALPNGVMTNATISGVASAPAGSMVRLTYKGGTTDVAIDDQTEITTATIGDRSLLATGKTAAVFATAATDGALTAGSIRVYGAGMKPTF